MENKFSLFTFIYLTSFGERERERGTKTMLTPQDGRHGDICALIANRSSDRSCARGRIHNKIHLIQAGFYPAQCSLQYRIVA